MKNYFIVKNLALFSLVCLLSACDVKEPPSEARPLEKEDTKLEAVSTKRDTTGLDILTDYDRDIWSGPEGWSDEQWEWKRTLRWDSECDYVGEVESTDLNDQIQLVTVQCVPGAYQPMSYLYLYNKLQEKSKPLNLGLTEISENSQEVWGNVEFHQTQKELSILTLSRGMGDCGTYSRFQFSDSSSVETATFDLKTTRRRDCVDHGGTDFDSLPKEIFDYKLWPIAN